MRLGGALRRTRKRKGRKKKRKTPPEQGAKKGRREGSRPGGRPLWSTALVLAALGWGLGYLLATRVVFPAPPPPGDLFEVPDVRGLGTTTAAERLAGVGLELGAVDSLLHPDITRSLILGQSPIPGQLATPGTPVRVTVSLGPQLRAVPDVTRLDAERARIVLQTTGFAVGVDTVESELPRGRVVEVFPPTDSVVALPGQVRLTVSAGPPLVVVPLVLGLEEAEAIAALDSLGLVVLEVEEVFRFGRDQGIVVEQEPAADSEVERGTEVRLAVGRRGRGG